MFNFNSPYTRFMAEAEGVESITSTHETHLNAAIKDFIRYKNSGLDITSESAQEMILSRHSLSLDDLDDYDRNQIIRKVAGR